MQGDATRERILDAAERLFAADGFAGASLRAVTREAGVNLAAVHYHFGSKEALYQAAFERGAAPLSAERLALLEEAERAAGADPPAVEAILRAFIAPDLRHIRDLGQRGRIVTGLLAHAHTEPAELARRLAREQVDTLGARFLPVLARALPGLPAHELRWRLHCVIGFVSHLLAAGSDVALGDGDDTEHALERLVSFAAAGLRAPLPGQARPASVAAAPTPAALEQSAKPARERRERDKARDKEKRGKRKKDRTD